MFVVTFYSYKGGVGRSLALANVATELSKRNKSVLIADFDLEAPGVSTFDFSGCDNVVPRVPGIVDFISDWLETGQSPDVRDFVCRNDSGDGGSAPIWIMPAGRLDKSYGDKLRKIDFGELYENHDGFLLFEDLKEQWRDTLKVDYVLIDSRTGHTDIGGVCTRQLPNLVVFVFWPNAQNLNGLTLILDDIREEEEQTSREIDKLFVPSNLPTLDDEDGLLKDLLKDFQSKLSYQPRQEMRIQSYPSLDLLSQKLFTFHRPNSRLAREYQKLTDAIQIHNVADETGVRLYLKRLITSVTRGGTDRPTRPGEADLEKLDQLAKKTWEDPEIRRMLAVLKSYEGEFGWAIQTIETIVADGHDSLSDQLMLAQWGMVGTVAFDALNTIRRLLNDGESSQRHILAALNLIAKLHKDYGPEQKKLIRNSPAIRRLTPQQIARMLPSLNDDATKIVLAGEIVQAAVDRMRADKDLQDGTINNSFALSLIGAGMFKDACRLLEVDVDTTTSEDKQRRTFNFAMADWGDRELPNQELFGAVIDLHAFTSLRHPAIRANYNQCLSLANAVCGRKSEALTLCEVARSSAGDHPTSFSCWTYLSRSQSGFISDLDAMKSWIEVGGNGPAVFFRKQALDYVIQSSN